MKRPLSFCLLLLALLPGLGRGGTITLTFTGRNAATGNSLPLESVYIQNTALGCDTIIYGTSPTFLLKVSTGIGEQWLAGSSPFVIMTPAPNPFNGSTVVRVQVGRAGPFRLSVSNGCGKVISTFSGELQPGMHKFAIEASAGGFLILTASNGQATRSVKLINTGGGARDRITREGSDPAGLKSAAAATAFTFRTGDLLLCKSIKSGYFDNILTDSPTGNTVYTFQLQAGTGVIAHFTYQQDAVDFKKVTFTNTSQNGTSYLWNFGDNSPLSNEVNPVHTYPAAGSYTVNLVATSSAGVSDTYPVYISVAETDLMMVKLAGDGSKTWKLLRRTNTGCYPLEVGPWDHSLIWWAMGYNNDELANRPCMLNDEWTFSRDGTLVFDAKGDYWAEGGVFSPDNICASTTWMTGPFGEDLSAWGSGTHSFTLKSGTSPTLTAKGHGAYVGFYKLGNGAETKIPLDSVRYNIISLFDGSVDTLIIEGHYQWDLTDGGYWRFVLMHYDDPSQEPPIPGYKPVANFTYSLGGMTLTLTNTTTGGLFYLWDFGDGITSTEQNPVHTYATEGVFTIVLTATNPNGSSTTSVMLMVSTTAITNALLQGGAWKIRVDDNSVFVGSGLGKNDWWVLPKSFMTAGTGSDDWTCFPDDEYTFGPGNTYTYQTMGSARNDGYFGSPNGCYTDTQIAASGNGAAFGSGTHSYAFTPASGTNRAVITLTNGPARAAFIGFYKGYYGGENANSLDPPNGGLPTNKYEVIGYANSGTREYLFVSVDISSAHDGSAAWSAILER